MNASIYGTAVNKDGSKINKTATVSTSWNGNVAYPEHGQYRLSLGSNPKQKITVYLNGRTAATVYVNGDTRVDLVRV